jgi:hypothetical protein
VLKRPKARTVLRSAIAFMLCISLFFPYFLDQIGSLRLLAVTIGFSALAVEILLLDVPLKCRVMAVSAVGAYLGLTVLTIEIIARTIDDRLFAVNAEHLFVLLPLFALLGWRLYRSAQGRLYLFVFLGVAFLVSLLAIAESLLGQSLIGREYEFDISQREGSARALVGSENVLVFGAILATIVPLTLKLTNRYLRLIVSIVLVLGVWSTGSRAPALLCTILAIVQLFPLLRALLQRFLWVVYVGAGVALAGLAYLSLAVWTPYISGSTGLEYSANYRGALYSLVPQFLIDRPFGYLLQTPSAGEWLVSSELHGTFDIARSVDSEIVYAIVGLGWVGLLMYLAAIFVAIAAIKHDVAIGLAALIMSTLGFSLALHGWDAMSPLWYSLIGICAGLTIGPSIQSRSTKKGNATVL